MAYEDVPVAEAVDLISTLPDGSRTASALSTSRAWSPEKQRAADVIDAMWAVATWQAGGVTQRQAMERAPHAVRPWEREQGMREAAEARRRAAAVRERIENTKWEEDDG